MVYHVGCSLFVHSWEMGPLYVTVYTLLCHVSCLTSSAVVFPQCVPQSTALTDLWLNMNLHEQMMKYSWLSEVFFIISARKQYFTLLLGREEY